MKKVKKRKYNDANMVYSSVKTYRRDVIQLITLILPAIILTIMFSYFPKYGILLAFKDYKSPKGIWGSPWVGLEHFRNLLGILRTNHAGTDVYHVVSGMSLELAVADVVLGSVLQGSLFGRHMLCAYDIRKGFD